MKYFITDAIETLRWFSSSSASSRSSSVSEEGVDVLWFQSQGQSTSEGFPESSGVGTGRRSLREAGQYYSLSYICMYIHTHSA